MKKNFLKRAFINKPLKKQVFSMKVFGNQWSVTRESLLPKPSRPMLFVYPHEKNPWAMDLITHFQADLSAWYEGGTLPQFDFIAADVSRDDLQDRLIKHPLLNGKHEEQASHIISIGDWCSQQVARFRHGRDRLHVSQIFCTQNDPNTLDMRDTGNRRLPNTNGVYAVGVDSYTHQIRSLRSIRPDVQRVGIIYDPKGGYESPDTSLIEQSNGIARECHSQGLRAIKQHFSLRTPPKDALAELAGRVDAIITLRDNTAYAYMDQLISFCNANNITLLTSELSSVYRGAALGFGHAPSAYVPHMIRLLVQEQLTTKQPLENLPLETVKEVERMTHNKLSLPQQGIKLSAQQEDLLDMIEVHMVH